MLASGERAGAVHANPRSDVENDVRIDFWISELEDELEKIGGWWHEAAKSVLFEEEGDDPNPTREAVRERLARLKEMILSDAATYGVVAALMIGVATSSLSVELPEASDLIIQVHSVVWSITFDANMLCLLASTIEYVNAISLLPRDILQRLAATYPKKVYSGSCKNLSPIPPFLSKNPEAMHNWAVRWSLDKYMAFRIGFWGAMPGVVTTVAGVHGLRFATVPSIFLLVTVVAGKIIWKKEHGSFFGQ